MDQEAREFQLASKVASQQRHEEVKKKSLYTGGVDDLRDYYEEIKKKDNKVVVDNNKIKNLDKGNKGKRKSRPKFEKKNRK